MGATDTTQAECEDPCVRGSVPKPTIQKPNVKDQYTTIHKISKIKGKIQGQMQIKVKNNKTMMKWKDLMNHVLYVAGEQEVWDKLECLKFDGGKHPCGT